MKNKLFAYDPHTQPQSQAQAQAYIHTAHQPISWLLSVSFTSCNLAKSRKRMGRLLFVFIACAFTWILFRSLACFPHCTHTYTRHLCNHHRFRARWSLFTSHYLLPFRFMRSLLFAVADADAASAKLNENGWKVFWFFFFLSSLFACLLYFSCRSFVRALFSLVYSQRYAFIATRIACSYS